MLINKRKDMWINTIDRPSHFVYITEVTFVEWVVETHGRT